MYTGVLDTACKVPFIHVDLWEKKHLFYSMVGTRAYVWSDVDKQYMGLGSRVKLTNREGFEILHDVMHKSCTKHLIFRGGISKHLLMWSEINYTETTVCIEIFPFSESVAT